MEEFYDDLIENFEQNSTYYEPQYVRKVGPLPRFRLPQTCDETYEITVDTSRIFFANYYEKA